MANDCNNYILITAERKDLDNFYNKIKKLQKKGFPNTLYYHLLDDYDKDFPNSENPKYFYLDIEKKEDEIIISGDSSWCPAVQLFTKLSEEFNLEIRYEYEERGCDLAGWATIKNGVCENNIFSYIKGCLLMDYASGVESLISETASGRYGADDLRNSDFWDLLNDDDKKIVLNSVLELPEELTKPF